MLGGTVGVGTIIAMATTGPFIQLCLPYGQKFTDFILINKDESQEELSMNTFQLLKQKYLIIIAR